MTGYTHATLEEQAVIDALKTQIPGKNPVLFEISIECDYNFFKINRPEYSPYIDLESYILLQDGLCLLVQQVEPMQVKIGQTVYELTKVCLQNIASLS